MLALLYKWLICFIGEQLFVFIKLPVKFCIKFFKECSYLSKKNKIAIEHAFQNFLRVNSLVWKKQKRGKKESIGNDEEYVLIEGLVNHPGYLLINLIIGKHLMDAYSMPGACLLHKPDRKQELLFKSYEINTFFYLSDRKDNFLDRIRNGLWSVKLLKRIRGIDAFIKFKINGINIGKSVYDQYLRTSGIGTVEHFSKALFRGTINALGYYQYCQKLFSSQSFPVVVQAEKQFVPYNIIFQTALKYGGVVYSRGGGPTSFTLRKYDNIDQIYINTFRYSRELYDYVYLNYRKQAVKIGEKIIRKRFAGESGPNDIPDAAFAFKKDQCLVQRKDLCDRFGWDVNRPIVGILANNLTDGVFTNRWGLFRDNLQWLRQTLKAVRNIDNVNWFVKPHPSDIKNRVKTDTRGEYEKWTHDCRHVHFLPEDVGSASLPGIVDVILTAHGSAGLEYSCFGKPCILGGESLYSGLGFTYEPQTQEEYFVFLENLHKLQPLEESQMDKVKTFAYIYLVLSRVKTDLAPVFSVSIDYDEEKLWIDAAALIQKNNYKQDQLRKMIKVQVFKKHRHLLNYNWIDLE